MLGTTSLNNKVSTNNSSEPQTTELMDFIENNSIISPDEQLV